MSERRFILKALMAGGLWAVAAPFDVARAQKSEPPTIAASSDLQPLLSEIAKGFEDETRIKLRIAVGAPRRLYSQIRDDAPFEMFLSADELLAKQLIEAGKTDGQGDVYAIGRLAFYAPSGSPLKADNFLADIRPALRDGRLQRLMIADPEADPYGRLAEEVLRQKQVWDEIQAILEVGDDISQTAQMAVNGAGQGALVAYSQAGQLMTARGGKCMLVSDSLYAPLKERMVLLKNAGDATRRFYRYMLSDKAKGSLKRFGFLLPE
ncbi:MAG: molybdate ABC transporter substrate-binding protein [Burkholderiales bacterium]|jgi:molybdate transport system substrate-binding protein|nr:molybdate ABC transporter substrate-binding protein [Burkholderiales bacterium]